MIICITGLPGSGKSTVANLIKQVLEEKGLEVLYYTTDWVRYKLYPELVGNRDEMGRDFTPDELNRSYNGLFMLFDELLKVNPKLVLITDGTFRKESQRAELKEIAQKHKGQCHVVKVEIREDILLPRLERRLKEGKGSGPSYYQDIKAAYEEPKGKNVIFIKNNGDLDSLKTEVNRLVDNVLAVNK